MSETFVIQIPKNAIDILDAISLTEKRLAQRQEALTKASGLVTSDTERLMALQTAAEKVADKIEEAKQEKVNAAAAAFQAVCIRFGMEPTLDKAQPKPETVPA